MPDPQALSTFEASILRRTELAEPGHARMLDWYRTLLALRRSVPDLASGNLAATDVTFGGGAQDGPWDGWLVLHRGSARVVINLSDRPLPLGAASNASLSVVAAWGEPGTGPDAVVQPRSVVVLA